jgi:hypothetical protein
MAAKDINLRIAAEVSWSRTYDRSARTRPARQKFLCNDSSERLIPMAYNRPEERPSSR